MSCACNDTFTRFHIVRPWRFRREKKKQFAKQRALRWFWLYVYIYLYIYFSLAMRQQQNFRHIQFCNLTLYKNYMAFFCTLFKTYNLFKGKKKSLFFSISLYLVKSLFKIKLRAIFWKSNVRFLAFSLTWIKKTSIYGDALGISVRK